MTRKNPAFLLLLLAFSTDALANKTSVALVGSDSAAAGAKITITVNVAHRGNSAFHHTSWVSVMADGAEIARWEFKGSNKPESENFSREVKFTVAKPVEFTAGGSCNIHGSQGPAVLRVGVS